MAGFSSIVGFIFAFFAMVLVFSSIFVIYNEQLFEQIQLLESRGQEYSDSTLYQYDLLNPYSSSGRLRVEIQNSGLDLKFKDKNSICFNFFVDNLLFAKDKLDITTLGHIANDYSIIEKDSSGYAHLLTNIDESKDYQISSISCGGIKDLLSLYSSKYNWWDSNWEQRNKILIKNPSSSSLVEYQVPIRLNSSNFDFNLGREEEIRFVIPLDEFLVLDLTFDKFAQNLQDYSRYSNSAVLGNLSSSESLDPQELASAVLFGGLSFDGINDLVKVTDDNSLDLDEELTYSTWIRWNQQGGDSYQTIISGSNQSNYLRIVNDGGVNNKSLEFSLRVGGIKQTLYSNTTLDSQWHFVAATYDGAQLKLYIDGVLSGNLSTMGSITTGSQDTIIGANTSNNYFKGDMDELKIYNIALNSSEIQDLYMVRLGFRNLDYYITNWNGASQQSDIYVKVPYLATGQNVSVELYYDNRDPTLTTSSNIENTFSYFSPKIIGYPVSNLPSSSTGLSILSFYNDTTVMVDSNSYNLNQMGTQTVGSGLVNQGSVIKTNKLVNVQGNGQGGDIIVPVSWASTQFYLSGMRNNPDRWCILSPWGNANVVINEAGSQINGGVVDSTGSCFNNNSGTSNGIEITSDIPVLAFSYGDASDDAYAVYPATTEDIYGVGTDDLYYAGPNGATITSYGSDGSTPGPYNIGASEGGNDLNKGQHGTAPAFRFVSASVKSGIHQADGDGAESGVFVPKQEMGTMFGSARNSQWIGIASASPNANCSVYNAGGYVETDSTSVGANGVYKYGFDLGNNNLYQAGPWRIECDKPVWPLFDDDGTNDETDMLSYLQMRQYMYPEPTVTYLG